MAVRVALGASRARLLRQMIAEALPLGIAGAFGGLILAVWMLQTLKPLLPATMPRVAAIGLHGAVVAFAIGTSLLVVVLASLVPGRVAARSQPAGTLQQTGRAVAAGMRSRDVLVVVQVAVTLLLVFGGLLFARSFAALSRVSPGFAGDDVLTMHLAVTRAKYPTDVQVADYYHRLIARVRSIPGVTAAGVVNRLPFSGIAQTGGVEFQGVSGTYDSDWRSATPGYFDAIGIPLLQGRVLSETDAAGSPAVGLIDERMARQVFGGASPVGRRFRRHLPGLVQQDAWAEVVGVVGHVLNDSLEKDPRPQVYWPETQRAQDRGVLVVRVAGQPEAFAKAIVQQVHDENPDQPVYDVRSMQQWVARTLQARTLTTGLVALFGGASLLLASLGLFGVVSYTASLRSREFGIRLALGARAGQIRGLVLRHAGRLALWGVAIGLALSWPAGRAVQSLLFGVTDRDPVSWVLAPALLAAVALLAGLHPAARSARSDPAMTLRTE
jgi:putative ABC transport system permease protein